MSFLEGLKGRVNRTLFETAVDFQIRTLESQAKHLNWADKTIPGGISSPLREEMERLRQEALEQEARRQRTLTKVGDHWHQVSTHSLTRMVVDNLGVLKRVTRAQRKERRQIKRDLT